MCGGGSQKEEKGKIVTNVRKDEGRMVSRSRVGKTVVGQKG